MPISTYSEKNFEPYLVELPRKFIFDFSKIFSQKLTTKVEIFAKVFAKIKKTVIFLLKINTAHTLG
jgi:hypothetical protein